MSRGAGSRPEPVGARGRPGPPVGRIVHTRQALPAVLPVNFCLDHDGAVLLRTSAASELVRAIDGSVVAFDADEVAAVGSCFRTFARARVGLVGRLVRNYPAQLGREALRETGLHLTGSDSPAPSPSVSSTGPRSSATVRAGRSSAPASRTCSPRCAPWRRLGGWKCPRPRPAGSCGAGAGERHGHRAGPQDVPERYQQPLAGHVKTRAVLVEEEKAEQTQLPGGFASCGRGDSCGCGVKSVREVELGAVLQEQPRVLRGHDGDAVPGHALEFDADVVDVVRHQVQVHCLEHVPRP